MKWLSWWWWLSAGLVVLNLSLAPIPGTETDIWWHLAAGRRFWQHGLELTDPYSFTEPNHPWIRIDWLFQVLLYPVYQRGGLPALMLLRSACLLGGAALVAFVLRRRAPAESWLLIMLVASIWAHSIALRPAALSLFFTTLWTSLLELGRLEKHRALWALPPLMWLWFNLHVASLAGILLLGLYAVGHTLERLRAAQKPDWLWWKILGLSFLATFVNPQGWKTVFYPIHFMLVKSPWRDLISEVQPPHWNTPGTWQARLLLGLALVGGARAFSKRQVTPLLVTLVIGFLMNQATRHQYQLCVTLVPWAALSLPRPLRAITAGAALLFTVHAAMALLVLRFPLSGLVRRESFSERLAALTAQGPHGLRVFVDMNAAGYFLYHFDGRQKVFIDSRTDQVYLQPGLLPDHQEIWTGGERALQLLDQYQIQAVVNNRLDSDGSPLWSKLKVSADWTCVSSDLIGELYVRNELVQDFPDLPQPAYLRDFLNGFSLEAEGRLGEAEASWLNSLKDYPQYASAYQWLGKLWTAQGKRAQARRALARAEAYHAENSGLDEDWRRLGIHWPRWLRAYFLPFWAL
ncbi:MAG: hypothetical protein KF760_05875 [Candidatus Eremiobacteraeota bacterium]|nr:hypothetical protein [Candidatus Eremiobacteraeota bacterium]